MPTGVALRDAREQMFAAAERILLRDGPHALTSRAVTTEAGVAKGVLHRHFADFDAFLAELIEDRIARIGDQAAVLRESAGTGTVAGNLTGVLTELRDNETTAAHYDDMLAFDEFGELVELEARYADEARYA